MLFSCEKNSNVLEEEDILAIDSSASDNSSVIIVDTLIIVAPVSNPVVLLSGNSITTSVNAIVIDTSDNIWVGSDSGLAKFDGTSWWYLSDSEGNIYNAHVQALKIDNEGVIWGGTKSGAFKFDGANLTNYKVENGLVSNDVRCIWTDKTKNVVWFGTSNNGISMFDGTDFTRDTVNIPKSMGNGHIHTICGDIENHVYFGSCISGLSKYDGTNWEHKLNNLGSFVECSSVAPDSSIWFGTGYGIFQNSAGNWLNYTVDEGLPSNFVYTIKVSSDETVWIATEFGASSFDGISFKIYKDQNNQNYGAINGFDFDSKGNVWAGGFQGLFKVVDKND